MTEGKTDALHIHRCPTLDRRHAGAGLHRLDGRRRRVHRHGAPAGGPPRAPADRRDRSRAVLHLQLPRLDGRGRPFPPRHQDRGRPGASPSKCPPTSSTATSRPTSSSSSARSRTCAGGRSATASSRRRRRLGVRRVLFVGSFGGAGAAHARAAAVRDLLRRAAAAGDGALRPAPHRLRRPRLVHHAT